MESVRIQLSGNRIKAYGRIVSAATSTDPAFSASYDLVTDEVGATKRLSLTMTPAERERQRGEPVDLIETLAERIASEIGPFGYRVFVDSLLQVKPLREQYSLREQSSKQQSSAPDQKS